MLIIYDSLHMHYQSMISLGYMIYQYWYMTVTNRGAKVCGAQGKRSSCRPSLPKVPAD